MWFKKKPTMEKPKTYDSKGELLLALNERLAGYEKTGVDPWGSTMTPQQIQDVIKHVYLKMINEEVNA